MSILKLMPSIGAGKGGGQGQIFDIAGKGEADREIWAGFNGNTDLQMQLRKQRRLTLHASGR